LSWIRFVDGRTILSGAVSPDVALNVTTITIAGRLFRRDSPTQGKVNHTLLEAGQRGLQAHPAVARG